MPQGCVFTIGSEHFEVDDFLSQVRFKPCQVFHAGEVDEEASAVRSESGFWVSIYQGEDNSLCAAIGAASNFLNTYQKECDMLLNFQGVEKSLIFTVSRVPHTVWPSEPDFFPSQLLALCGSYGIGIYITHLALDPIESDWEEHLTVF